MLLRNASLRFLIQEGYQLSPRTLPDRFSENVLPLLRKFCSATIGSLPKGKVNGEIPGQDAAGMSHIDKETSHGGSSVGVIRKVVKKQGPKNRHGTKANISTPQAFHYHEKELPGRSFQPYLFQIVLDTPRNSLVSVLDKWIQDGNCLEKNEVLLALFHLRKQRLYSKALQRQKGRMEELASTRHMALSEVKGLGSSCNVRWNRTSSLSMLTIHQIGDRDVDLPVKRKGTQLEGLDFTLRDAPFFMEWIEREKLLHLEEHDYACHLDLIARNHGIDAAQKYIERVPKPLRNEVLYESLLVNCVCLNYVQKAEEVFQEIRKLSLPLTVSACNQMLLLYKRVARTKVADILMLMEEENIKPSPFTYKLLIDLKGRSNDISGMELVLDKMKADGVEPDFSTQTMVVKFYINGGLTEKAEEAIRAMEVYKNDNRHAIRSLLDLYAILGRPDDVARTWESCTEPKLDDYLAAIGAWGKLGHIEQVEETYEALVKISPKLSSKYFNAMLNVYAENKLLSKGKEFLERMCSAGCPSGPLTWDALVNLYVNSGEVEKADSFLLKVAEENPDRYPLFCLHVKLLKAYAEKGDIHNA
ncbi:hypothetical protein EJB05_13426, partial [Eragrostis curvula]